MTFGDIIKLLGWLAKLLNWRRWKKRAEDAEEQNKLDDQTHDAETDIRDAADQVTRPPHGPDDDLLNAELALYRAEKVRDAALAAVMARPPKEMDTKEGTWRIRTNADENRPGT